jgi:nucleotide-binding universal stress UspA family protein
MMTTAAPPAGFIRLVVGYDGSPPATRAFAAAVRLLQGRAGGIDVVYVAQLSSLAALSPGAIAEIESDFEEIEQELRTAAAGQLRASEVAWEFERRQGIAADQLIAVATAVRDAHGDKTVGMPPAPACWPRPG